ncbi:MAG: metallophosphoesterase family protein [Acidobacteriota bacterium]
MRIAILADVHANLSALETVFDAISHLGIDRMVCLGDLVGYNAEPAQCIHLIRTRCQIVVAGNHDHDVAGISQAPGTHSTAHLIQAWTRSQLSSDDRAYLANLPNRIIDPEGFVAVHGCYLNDTHITGYVTGTMLEANLNAILAREGWPHIGLCGHTHTPMVGWLDQGKIVECKPDKTLNWPASARAVLINPGSVGQPRDGDSRAAFAIIDIAARQVEIHRVAYDIEATAKSIANACLPGTLAERLREGR